MRCTAFSPVSLPAQSTQITRFGKDIEPEQEMWQWAESVTLPETAQQNDMTQSTLQARWEGLKKLGDKLIEAFERLRQH